MDFNRHVPRTCYSLLTASISNKAGKFVPSVVLEKVAGSHFRRIGISTAFLPSNYSERLTRLIDKVETQELSIE